MRLFGGGDKAERGPSLLARMLSRLLGESVQDVLFVSQNMIIVSAGEYALRYTTSSSEILVKLTGNEVRDKIRARILGEKYHVTMGEKHIAFSLDARPGIFSEVKKLLERADAEYEKLLKSLENGEHKVTLMFRAIRLR
jgi:hypothetical protein